MRGKILADLEHLEALEAELYGERFMVKRALLRAIEPVEGPPPVLLIDDVFGELDPGRGNALMAAWPRDSQKLITTTHLDWLDDRFADARVMRLLGRQGAN